MPDRNLTEAEIAQAGVTFPCQVMENGQKRYRLNTPDGPGYLVLYAGPTLAWDKSHSHTSVREIVHVYRGSVLFVFLKDKKVNFRTLREGEYIELEPSPPHCLLMGTGSILQVMKTVNDPDQRDWIPCPELDDLLTHINPADVFK